ncbi:kinase [Pseudoxanthomonas dokdonensis]|uniref:Kinase n=1 Tax=Pseudoxanthomonas dokdonensis TaxID=344882 RepID=A0A0R0CKZ9_9GAMM|nr:kinase [Pseudoxanthomonas dokdonensis]
MPLQWAAAALEMALTAATAPPVLGIAGVQGSGKSTLAAQLASLAGARGLRVAVLSLDDVYLSRQRRARLAADVHPLLQTRGPPGSHDLPLALEVISQLRAGAPTRLPRFDKLADDPWPLGQWPRIEGKVDLIVLEGWCLCVPAESQQALLEPINALEREEDGDGRWRQWCNQRLASDYPPLWQLVQPLICLQAPDFDVVPLWRWQQEQSLAANRPGRTPMTLAQIRRFVQFFERISRQGLRIWPSIADSTLALDDQRRPIPPLR